MADGWRRSIILRKEILKMKIANIESRLEIYVGLGVRKHKNEFKIGLKRVPCVFTEI